MRMLARSPHAARVPSPVSTAALVMFSISLGAACASRGTPGSTGPAAPPPPLSFEQAPVVLTVENHNWQDIVVYAVYDGSRSRLGMITTARTVSFRLPPRLIGRSGNLYFIADPIGASKRFESEMVVVQPGQIISWTLETGLERSSISIRN